MKRLARRNTDEKLKRFDGCMERLSMSESGLSDD